ncbi:MAG: hypothetical protein NWE96_00950 [Candidatus Bathyarchaeota archaeon]|nr:hypothetical protein [Candidatus Bathyarchaeota archaeon]
MQVTVQPQPTPYTGQTTTTQHPNRTIQVTITNQPTIDNSHPIYYNIRVRPHFEGDWTELYPIWKLPNTRYNWETKTWTYSQYLYTKEMSLPLQTPIQSSGQYTTITLPLDENPRYPLNNLPDNAKLDFQVEAFVGHDAQSWAIQHPLNPEYGGYFVDSVAYDSDSGWSGTRTISLPDGSVFVSTPDPTASSSVTPTSTASPMATVSEKSTSPTAQSNADSSAFPGLEWVEIVITMLLAAVVVLLGLVVVYLRKRSLK